MNICVNYYGQPRGCKPTLENYMNNIHDNTNKFHILYTTWKTEDITQFKNIFPNSYIRQVEPNLENYHHVIEKFGDFIKNYLMYLYIIKNSLDTIKEYEDKHKIKFDVIITIRPDNLILKSPLKDYYNELYNNQDVMLLALGPCWDLYKTGAYQAATSLSSREHAELHLNIIDIIHLLNIEGRNELHPETSAFNLLKYYTIKYKFCDYWVSTIR